MTTTTESRPHKKIHGRLLAKALHDAGLIPGDLNGIRRIVIDIQASDVPVMYVEYFMDDRWLEVVTVFDGIEVRTKEPE
jgi:hypothetical protein